MNLWQVFCRFLKLHLHLLSTARMPMSADVYFEKTLYCDEYIYLPQAQIMTTAKFGNYTDKSAKARKKVWKKVPKAQSKKKIHEYNTIHSFLVVLPPQHLERHAALATNAALPGNVSHGPNATHATSGMHGANAAYAGYVYATNAVSSATLVSRVNLWVKWFQ